MSRPRVPRVAGVAGGVGTTTLAAALRGHDGGRDVDLGVDVLVCRSTGHSLRQAAVTITRLAAAGRPRPILAVTADRPRVVGGAVRARLRMMEPQVAALVLLPYVPRWRELADPLAEATGLARPPATAARRALHGYAHAVAGLAERLIASRLLTRTAPEPPGRRAPDRPGPGRPPGPPTASSTRTSRPTGPATPTRVGTSRPAGTARPAGSARPATAARPVSTAGPVSATAPVHAVPGPPRVHRPSSPPADHLDLPLARVAELGGGAR